MVFFSELLQRNERVFVSHLGKRESAPEANFLGWVVQINPQNTV
jgi:hypothetical protein